MQRNVSITKINHRVFKVRHFNSLEEEKESLVVCPQPPFIEDGGFWARADGQTQLVSFYQGEHLIFSECVSPYRLGFSIGENDGIFGLGMHQNKPLNRRNSTIWMAQKNGRNVAVPFLTSTANYAILFDHYAYMSIGIDRDCQFDSQDDSDSTTLLPNEIHLHFEDESSFTYYLILADSIDEQISAYRELTGNAALYPLWAYGFIQSKEHYQTQEQLCRTAAEFRKNHIPLDCIVQDWNYWGDLGWNALLWDKKKYPDPSEMLRYLHDDLKVKLMLSIWPSFSPQTQIAAELEEIGAILEQPNRYGEKWGRVHDAYNPAAADLIWIKMKQEFFDIGVDAWWLDSSEPCFEEDSSILLHKCNSCFAGENVRYLNTYALMESSNVYHRQRKADEKKRVFILTRSGFAGQQSVGSVTWTGDIEGNWAVFRTQIPALLGFSSSGIPYSTTDIGGFFVNYEGGCNHMEYRELYTRWFWFGVFSPIFRSHGSSTPREIWNFGEPGTLYYDAQLAGLSLRYRLLPYLYGTAYQVYANHKTFIRPLVMAFPQDRMVYDIEDSYMFGECLLVSPVVIQGADSKTVYLPAGTEWVNFFSGERFTGGQSATVPAPLHQIPLFIKAGSILLTGKPMEYTEQYPQDSIVVMITTGSNAHTAFYEDWCDGYSYEEGVFILINFNWDDARRELIIEEAKGCIAQFNLQKEFHIFINGKVQETVNYNGKPMVCQYAKVV